MSDLAGSAPVVPPARGAVRRRLAELFEAAKEANLENLERAVTGAAAGGRLLDLGCDDGELTLRFARASGAARVDGVEVVPERAELAAGRGISVTVGDLNGEIPLPDSGFDVVVSNQVIEHLANTDSYLREVKRLLRPGGLAAISTENLASWHNIAALVLGWQPFSLTNVSETVLGIGNPAAIHRGQRLPLRSWQHLRLFAHRGLRELLEAHGFEGVAVHGAGYYPLPARLGRRDPRHAAFLAAVARRPADSPNVGP